MSLDKAVKCQESKCPHTNLAIVPEESRFIDFQIVRLQELPEDLPPGQLPHYVNVSMKQDLVDYARPGDRNCFKLELLGLSRSVYLELVNRKAHFTGYE